MDASVIAPSPKTTKKRTKTRWKDDKNQAITVGGLASRRQVYDELEGRVLSHEEKDSRGESFPSG